MAGIFVLMGTQLEALAGKTEATAARMIAAVTAVEEAGGGGGRGAGGSSVSGGGKTSGNTASYDVGSESSLIDTLSQVPNGPSATAGRY